MAINPAKRLHVVAIPYPAQGHINPMLQLCEQLVPRGFAFTFINTHHIHQRLQHSNLICMRPPPVHDAHQKKEEFHHAHNPAHGQKAGNSEDGHVFAHDADSDAGHVHPGQGVHHYKGCSSIRMMFVEGGCAPERHAHISTLPAALRAAQEMREPVERLLSQIREEGAVDFIMSDIFLGWSSAIAHKFDLPWVSLWPSSAASLSAFIYSSDLVNQGKQSIHIAEMEAQGVNILIEDIPGLPATHLCDVPKVWDDEGKLRQDLIDCFKNVHHASVVLVNTFMELEGAVVAALSQRFRMLAVGPLLPSRYLLRTCPDRNQEEFAPCIRPSLFPEDSGCLAWLDTQAPSSVLFISFGSISLRSKEQLQELAYGVAASGCPFLWVCKPDISNALDNSCFSHKDGLPQGLLVPWAPQLEVLSHTSVGGFLTHCGWNSVLESVSMGVPMLCWADIGERMCNQRCVVNFWKCGLQMVGDTRRAKQHVDKGMLVDRQEVEKSIRSLMLEESGSSIRLHATKLRNAAIQAYGDSRRRLNDFFGPIKNIQLGDYSR